MYSHHVLPNLCSCSQDAFSLSALPASPCNRDLEVLLRTSTLPTAEDKVNTNARQYYPDFAQQANISVNMMN